MVWTRWLAVLALLVVETGALAQTPVGKRCTTAQHRIRVRNVVFNNLERPSKTDVLESAVQPVSVHYNASTVALSKAQAVLRLAEQAWDVEVNQMGWPAPLADRNFGGNPNLDFYLDALGDGSAYTAPDSEDPGMNHDAAMAYIVLDQSIPEADLPFFVFHEFNHACQFALDAGEADAVFEWTSSFVEYVTQPDAVALTNYFPAFNGSPQDALDDFTHLEEYEYGASMFLFFVVQRYFNNANEVVRDLWVGSQQKSTGSAYVNEPDILDALGARLPPEVTLPGVYAEFGRWRSFVGDDDDGHHMVFPAEPPANSEMFSHATVRWAAFPYSTTVDLAETGSARINVEGGTIPVDRALRARVVDGAADDQLDLTLMLVEQDGSAPTLMSGLGAEVELVTNLRGGIRGARVIITRLGDGMHDPDDQEWAANSYGITLDLVDPTQNTPDAGSTNPPPGDDVKKGLCVCTAVPHGPLQALVFVGIVLARLRWRRCRTT